MQPLKNIENAILANLGVENSVHILLQDNFNIEFLPSHSLFNATKDLSRVIDVLDGTDKDFTLNYHLKSTKGSDRNMLYFDDIVRHYRESINLMERVHSGSPEMDSLKTTLSSTFTTLEKVQQNTESETTFTVADLQKMKDEAFTALQTSLKLESVNSASMSVEILSSDLGIETENQWRETGDAFIALLKDSSPEYYSLDVTNFDKLPKVGKRFIDCVASDFIDELAEDAISNKTSELEDHVKALLQEGGRLYNLFGEDSIREAYSWAEMDGEHEEAVEAIAEEYASNLEFNDKDIYDSLMNLVKLPVAISDIHPDEGNNENHTILEVKDVTVKLIDSKLKFDEVANSGSLENITLATQALKDSANEFYEIRQTNDCTTGVFHYMSLNGLTLEKLASEEPLSAKEKQVAKLVRNEVENTFDSSAMTYFLLMRVKDLAEFMFYEKHTDRETLDGKFQLGVVIPEGVSAGLYSFEAGSTSNLELATTKPVAIPMSHLEINATYSNEWSYGLTLEDISPMSEAFYERGIIKGIEKVGVDKNSYALNDKGYAKIYEETQDQSLEQGLDNALVKQENKCTLKP